MSRALSIGEACADSSQCSSGFCTLGPKRYCTSTCDPKAANSCVPGTHCGEIGSALYCLLDERGCSASGRPTTVAGGLPGGALLLFACAVLLLRRRGRCREVVVRR